MRLMLAAVLVLTTALLPADAQVQGHTRIGIGFGRFYSDDGAGGLGSPGPAAGVDSQIGARVGEHAAVFVYTGLVINDVATGVGYTDWVFQNDDYTVLRAFFLSWLIPMAFLLDSHVVVGPGIAFYTRAEAPSIFLEGGVGLSSNQSVADGRFTLGGAVFGGAGVDLTGHLGFVLRAIWAPSEMNSRWTPDGEALSLLAMLRFH